MLRESTLHIGDLYVIQQDGWETRFLVRLVGFSKNVSGDLTAVFEVESIPPSSNDFGVREGDYMSVASGFRDAEGLPDFPFLVNIVVLHEKGIPPVIEPKDYRPIGRGALLLPSGP